MKYQPQLQPDEVVTREIDQDLAGRGILFWRQFRLTLTNKRLHGYRKYIFSHGQKSFDLRDIDSVYYERKFNGIYSFLLGLLLAFIVRGIGLSLHLVIYGSSMPVDDSIQGPLGLITTMVWLIVFLLFLFKRQIVIRSRNDKMAIDVVWMSEHLLTEFINSVLEQKEHIVAPSTFPGTNAATRIKELDNLYSQNLISKPEYEKKRNDILNNL